MEMHTPLAVVVARSRNATQVAAPGAGYRGLGFSLLSKEVKSIRTRTGVTSVEIPGQYDKEDDCKRDHRDAQTPHDYFVLLSG